MSAHTLIEELTEIDSALLSGDATPEQEARGHELVTMANAAPDLLEAAKIQLLARRAAYDDDANAELLSTGWKNMPNLTAEEYAEAVTRAAIEKAEAA